jgi:hypothetical protein
MKRFLSDFRLFVAIAMLCLTFTNASGQHQIDSVRRKFDRYRTNNPQEKLFIHTDQDLYLTGETLWFKVYYVDGVLHQRGDISKVAYVEILSHDNQPVIQTKVALKNGEGYGALFLPASISSGNYHLRAYTQWMKNFDPEFFFNKSISIVNTFRKLDIQPEKSDNTNPILAQFFPEGGDLVYGLRSKVAFQATNPLGKGIDFSGIITNAQNDTLLTFRPTKYGIGNFTFTPNDGNSYKAVLIDGLGNSRSFNLPLPKPTGYVIDVRDSTTDLLMINVTADNQTVQSSPTIYYVIHARQIISSAGSRELGSPKTAILIPKRELKEGISHITIFDASLKPVCERLYFKLSEKKLNIAVKANQNEYGIRRKVLLDISVQNDSATIRGTSLSVAIVKSDSLHANLAGNIFNYLWLSSDLRGDVEDPAYYMAANSQEVSAALDNLMLTHGWRRFNWADVLSNKKSEPVFLPEYRGHLIRGIVVDKDDKPTEGIATYLSTPGKNIQLYAARSTSNGEVQYEMKDFWGARKIIVQTNTNQDSTFRVKILNPFADAYATYKLPPLTIESSVSKNLLNRSIAMQVQDIYYGDKSIKFSSMAIDSTAFYGKANETYFLDDYTRFTVMEEVMREYVPGVMVRIRRDGFHFLVLDNVRKGIFKDDPLILLDGMPVFDVDKIMEFDPLKVKKLEVLTSRYYLGPLHFPGIVSYSTYTGDLAGFQLDPRSVSMNYEALQRQRIFYSPQYETEKQRDSRMPDRRNLLFWAPEVRLDSEGKSQVEFFTSDLTGNYSIVVEGLSQTGYSGSTTSTMVVKHFNN